MKHASPCPSQKPATPQGLNPLAEILLHNGPELDDAPLLHQVLEPGLLAVIAPAVVALRRQYGLEHVEDVVLGHIAQAVRQARKGAGLPARPMSCIGEVLRLERACLPLVGATGMVPLHGGMAMEHMQGTILLHKDYAEHSIQLDRLDA